MLVLTRQPHHEKYPEDGKDMIVIDGGRIIVKILGVDRDRVKVGVTAPPEIQVLRGELCQPSETGEPPSP